MRGKLFNIIIDAPKKKKEKNNYFCCIPHATKKKNKFLNYSVNILM